MNTQSAALLHAGLLTGWKLLQPRNISR